MTLRPQLLLTLLICLSPAFCAVAQDEGEEGTDETAEEKAEGTSEGEGAEETGETADGEETEETGETADGEETEEAEETADAEGQDGEEGVGESGDLDWGEGDMPDFPGMGDEETEEDTSGQGPDIQRADDEDIEDWEGEIEKQDLNQVVEREEVKVEVEAEPERIGISGNWYLVDGDCLYCDTVLGQNLDVQDGLVMRQFFDHLQINPDAATGKMVFPSEGTNRPLLVQRDGDHVVVFMYAIDEGERTTPTFCTVWDLQWLLRDKRLLYGRRYTVDAYQLFAFTQWERGYKADETFLPVAQLRTFLDLDLVHDLDADDKTFPVGEKAVLTYLGSAAFVRSDFDPEPYEDLQARLFKARVELEEREAEREGSMTDGVEAFENGDYERCLELLLRAGELGEDSLDYHFYLGASYQGTKRYDEAIGQYRLVLATDPMDTVTRYNLGRILEKLGRYKEAIHEYRVVLKHDPEDEEARDRMFDLMLELQDFQE